MAPSAALSDVASRICEGNFNFGTPCMQRIVIDSVNVSAVVVFYLILLIGLRKKNVLRGYRNDWISIALSVCCALTMIKYFAVGLSYIIYSGDQLSDPTCISTFVRGITWITLSVSVLVRGSKWLEVMASTWWIVFFLLISALNMEELLKSQIIQILEVILWLVNLLLCFCAIRNLHGVVYQPAPDKSLLESLIVEDSSERYTGIGHASFFKKLSFSWMNPLLRLGNSKSLSEGDIPHLESDDEASVAYGKFHHAWTLLEREKGSRNPGNLVFWGIARVYWRNMVLAGVFASLRALAVVVSPLLLYAFVGYSNKEEKNHYEGLSLVGCLVIVKLVESLSYRHFCFYSRRIGMRMRSALIVAVYQKQIKLSNSGRQRHSTGEIVNYIAADAYRMGDFPMWFHIGLASAVQVFLAIAVLFRVVRVGVLPGLIPFIICGILNVPFAKVLQKYQTKFMTAQDKRLRSMSEILNNMKVIKLQSWEEKFKSLIESFRANEFKWLAETQYKKTYSTVLYWMSPTLVSSVIFFGCLLLKSAPLDAGTIFTVLAVLRTMSEPGRLIPEALSVLIQVKVSFERINLFMLEDELKHEDQSRPPYGKLRHIVHIQSGDFDWGAESTIPALRNITLEVRQGQKIAICGPVGSGKSSLLYAILDEIPKTKGTVEVFGSIAYVSQASWIQSGTIQDNILFGKPMDEAKYEEVIRICALEKDIGSFDYGDLTEIGQRGLNLSGGQKQRLQLARAVYSDADIYLLDDPFSAVDTHTCALMIESRIPKYFWPEAVATAIYLVNCLPTKILNLQTPLDIFSHYTKIPPVLTLPPQVFGCTVP